MDFPQANRLTVHILAAVAEHEAKAISERTRAALAAAKARGKRLGGDRGNLPAVAKRGSEISVAVRSQKADRRAADLVADISEDATAKQLLEDFLQRRVRIGRPDLSCTAR